MEFLENAAIVQENEIQAAHWSHTESSIFPAYAWIEKDVSQNVAINSDAMDHTKLTAFIIVNYLFSFLNTEYLGIKYIQMFSDEPSSQFKQRYLL